MDKDLWLKTYLWLLESKFFGYQLSEISIYKNSKHGSTIQRKLKIFHRKLTFKETQKGDYII